MTAFPRSTRARHGSSRSFEQAFDFRRNSLNALRVLFAAFVVIGHGYHLGLNLTAPHLGSLYIGDVGVDGFFVISGFLITNSRLRPGSTTLSYLRDRALRIFPAYWVCLVVCAVVVAPAVLAKSHLSASGAFTARDSATGFVLKNSLLLQAQHTVAGMLRSGPVPGTLNGSLWTLLYEFIAYIAIAMLACRTLASRRTALAMAAFGLCWIVLLGVTVWPETMVSLTGSAELVPRGSRLGLMFLSGTVLRLYWHKIPCSRNLALASLVIVLAAAPLSQPRLVTAPFFAYVVVYLGTQVVFQSVGQRVDISYGLYLYAWPVELLLRAYGVQRHGLIPFVVLALALSSLAGTISYVAVERPALSLKNRYRTRGKEMRATTSTNQKRVSDAERDNRLDAAVKVALPEVRSSPLTRCVRSRSRQTGQS